MNKKIAFVCDWLTGMRGGERCLEAMCRVYPQADIYSLVHYPDNISEAIESHKITSSYIQKLPGNKKTFRRYLPLFQNAIRRFDFSKYDLVLSFSHCVAKDIMAKVPHISYCFTPMRYAWYMREEYLGKMSQFKRLIAESMLNYLQKKDMQGANGVTEFIAISKNVQARIKQAYNRDSAIIYPPVECNRFNVSQTDDGYYLIVSALVPYKRIDIAIEAFNHSDKKLIVVGTGKELNYLKNISVSKNIIFIENASDTQVEEYLKNCRALIFPGEEDFGIVPLEAQACGKPVIAFGRGGVLETVITSDTNKEGEAGATGVFFYKQTPSDLMAAVSNFEHNSNLFKAENSRNNALKFDLSNYQSAMKNYIEKFI
jgi:glycosyltransferase involved in cell wall biosynthesis